MKVHFNGMIFDLNISGHRYLLHNEVDEIAYYRVMREMATEEDEEVFNAHVQLIHDSISNKDIEKLCELDLDDLEIPYRFNYVEKTLIELLEDVGYEVEEVRNDVYIVENDEGDMVKITNRAHVTDFEYKYVVKSKDTTVTKSQLENVKLHINSEEEIFYF